MRSLLCMLVGVAPLWSCLCDNRQVSATMHPSKAQRGQPVEVLFVTHEDIFRPPFDDLGAQFLVMTAEASLSTGTDGARNVIHHWSNTQSPADSTPFVGPVIEDTRIMRFILALPPDWPTGRTTIGVGVGRTEYGQGIRATGEVDVQ
jgi:hypothetical protein